MAHRLKDRMAAAYDAGAEAIRHRPGTPEQIKDLGATAGGLGAAITAVASELEETDRIVTAIAAALATMSAHVAAIAEYIKYEHPAGLPALLDDRNTVEAYIEVARTASDLLAALTSEEE